jgi:septal ring factor EnvC (AmiA/AmiB activator)
MNLEPSPGAALDRALAKMARQEDLLVVKRDVEELKTDVAMLKTDVAMLKTDVAMLKTDVAGLKTEFGEFRQEVRTAFSDVLRAIDANTMALREDLNREFAAAQIPVRLETAPRKKAR